MVTDKELRSLGVCALGQRRKLLAAAANLKAGRPQPALLPHLASAGTFIAFMQSTPESVTFTMYGDNLSP